MKDKPKCGLRQVVLLRHGESVWNKENRFTGWTDVDLSERGGKNGQEAGRGLKEHGFTFDVAFTSVLKRAIRTLWLVLDEMDLMWIPVHRDWRLNGFQTEHLRPDFPFGAGTVACTEPSTVAELETQQGL